MPGVCPRCNREVYFAEQRLALGKVWHTFCFSCRNCRKLLDSCSVATHRNELFCKNCYARLFPLNASLGVKITPGSSPRAPLSISLHDSRNCVCCCPENPDGDSFLNREQNFQSDKCRLRGGGSEEEETNVLLKEVEKHFLGDECMNVCTVTSEAKICSVQSTPTAWYNRRSEFLSNVTSELWKSNSLTKICPVKSEKSDLLNSDEHCSQSGVLYQRNQEESNFQLVGFDCDDNINITNGQLSISIPSRRKLTYPPVPSPRSPLPSRRRVSFCDVVFGERCVNDRNRVTKMQDSHNRSCCDNDGIEEHNSSYDIWQANGLASKNDGGYKHTSNASRTEDVDKVQLPKDPAECVVNTEDTLKESEEIDNSGDQDRCIENTEESRTHRMMNERDTDNASLSENVSMYVHKNVQNLLIESDHNERMRGGCGSSCTAYPNDRRQGFSRGNVKHTEGNTHNHYTRGYDYNSSNSRPNTVCSQGKNAEHYDSCPPREPDFTRNNSTACSTCASPCVDRHGCCSSTNDQPVCKKTILKCRQSCTSEPQSCGAGGCCGSGCRGGCGKPGQTCMPSRSCSMSPSRPHSPSVGAPCSPQRLSLPETSYSHARKMPTSVSASVGENSSYRSGGSHGRKSENCCGSGGATSYSRSRSPGLRGREYCNNDGANSTDGAWYQSKLSACECLGGGPDCQRCGRKVYQAEMQIASGVPYHNICFSCFCCRKPLESLTYQENCGEIYCKQCYVRNFGPQGYGYGIGAGALQTPM